MLTAPSGIRAESSEVSRSQEVRARVFKLLNAGIQAYNEGRAKEAIPILRQASDTALNSFRAYYYLGLALKVDRQYQAAIEPLQISIELDPTNLPAHVALGDCWLKKGDPAEALAEYHRALALQSDYAPAHDGLGRAAEAAGDDEKAVEHYRKAIDLNPGFPDGSLNLGDLLLRQGRYDEAIELFLKAINVRPDFASAYNRLGVAYAKQQYYNEAIAALRLAETLEKGNPWHAVTIGGIFLALDNLAQAEREFTHALELDPDYLDAHSAMAGLMRRKGEFGKSIEQIEKGLVRDVDDPAAKAKLKEFAGRIAAEAAQTKTLDDRLSANPDDGVALSELADLRAARGDHAGAVALLNRAMSLTPAPDATLLGRLGYSALKAEMDQEGARAYEALSRLAPADADVLINLGLARSGVGDTPGAEAALREASRLRPGDTKPLVCLANLYTRAGQRNEAVSALNAALALAGTQGDAAFPPGQRARIDRLLKALMNEQKAGS